MKTTPPPLVSVLMTAYNREQYIAEAIESVLASTYTNFELILVDDASTDGTVEIARTYVERDSRVRLYRNESNLGDYPNRNRAASYAKGKYIKYLDSDDIIYPHSLTIMVESLENNANAVAAVSTYLSQCTSGPYPLQLSPRESYYESFFRGLPVFQGGPGGSIIRREIFDAMGGFSAMRHTGDVDFWLRLGRYHHILVIQSGLIWWRVHPGQENKLGWKNNKRLAVNYPLILSHLRHSDVPLSREEQRLAIRGLKNLHGRALLRVCFIQMRPWQAFDVMRKSGYSFWDLFICWIPYNRLRKALTNG